MENIYSKSEDVMLLAQKLKNSLGNYVSFNKFGIDNPILTGVYCKNGSTAPYYGEEDVRFYIKFCRDNFLRIQISEECNKDEDIINAMEMLIKSLATISIEDSTIGFPLAIYETDESLTCEYAFKNVKETINALQNGTMFDDGDVKNLRFFGNCNNCNFGSYGYDCSTGMEKLYCAKHYYEDETKGQDTCEEHAYIDGEIPNIKVLCKSFDIDKKSRM